MSSRRGARQGSAGALSPLFLQVRELRLTTCFLSSSTQEGSGCQQFAGVLCLLPTDDQPPAWGSRLTAVLVLFLSPEPKGGLLGWPAPSRTTGPLAEDAFSRPREGGLLEKGRGAERQETECAPTARPAFRVGHGLFPRFQSYHGVS